jgi:hypothetical protein
MPLRLPDLDQMPIGVADVAADSSSRSIGGCEELRAAATPLFIQRLHVGHAEVEERACPIGARWGLEDDRRLVGGRTTGPR